ncbi:MAG TPA: histidine phosphatase family protein, partial [Paracoccaceae bacterium]|nr:histidine phosphatase family protein [Paracoccaceae bacterium]
MTPAGHRRLILTRHAKSAWDDPTMSDHDRPLNGRGRRSALELGEWLQSRGYEPDQVLCSTATRTRETWATVAVAPLEVTPHIDYLDALYHASPDLMQKALA